MNSARLARPPVAGRRSVLPPAAPQRLAHAERAFFESRLDHDFSQVRVHTGSGAARLADDLGAKAYATGDDIVFGDGRYAPGTASGRELIAHELAHVAQQRQGGGAPAQAESRAQAAAGSVARGASVAPQSLGGADPGVHCDPVVDADKKPLPDKPVQPGALPPFTPLQLTQPGPIDWLKMREPYTSRGLTLGERDARGIESEAERQKSMLRLFGIDDKFKLNLGFMTIDRDWIINKGISKQLDDTLGRENPTQVDRLNTDFDRANPGFKTPIVGPSWSF